MARPAHDPLDQVNRHRADAVLVGARTIGGRPDVTAARGVSMDASGLELAIDGLWQPGPGDAPGMPRTLTLDDVARLSDEPSEELSRWRRLGLVGAAGDETFQLRDVERARLVRLLLER